MAEPIREQRRDMGVSVRLFWFLPGTDTIGLRAAILLDMITNYAHTYRRLRKIPTVSFALLPHTTNERVIVLEFESCPLRRNSLNAQVSRHVSQ